MSQWLKIQAEGFGKGAKEEGEGGRGGHEMISAFKTKLRDWAQLWVKIRRTRVPKGVMCPSEDCQILGEGVGHLLYS